MDSYITQPIVPLKFSIAVDVPSATFFIGQPVTGRVFFSLPAPIRAKSVTIELIAETRVKVLLFGGRISKAMPSNRHRIASCKPSRALWMPPYMSDRKLPAGNSTMPFSIDTTAFPKNMPPSFEGEYGAVRYYLRAKMERHSFEDTGDHIAELPVKMLPMIDIDDPFLAQPAKSEKESQLGSKGGVFTSIVVARTGFLPEDSVNVEVTVANNTRNKLVETLQVSLVQKTEYNSKEQTKSNVKVLDVRQVLDRPIMAQGSTVVTSTLRVPVAAYAHPTVITPRVALTYYVKVVAMSSHGVVAENQVPILVGTIRAANSAAPKNEAADEAHFKNTESAAPLVEIDAQDEVPMRAISCLGCVEGSNVGCSGEGDDYATLRESHGFNVPLLSHFN
eukprot:m51a1_g12366 hypothetical protein (391) ;mRNA; r:585853-587226